MTENLDSKTPRELLNALVTMTVNRRWQNVYNAVTPRQEDKKSVQQDKAHLLFILLEKWAADPLTFIEDLGWVSDPRGEFGSRAIKRGLAPRQMTPFIPFTKQAELCVIWKECLDAEGRTDFAGAKSRQVAMSWFMDLLAIWAWLFRGDTHGVLTTYKRDYIDAGGKGQRSPVSIFGRLRLALDAIFWCLPQLKFNQHENVGKSRVAQMAWRNNLTGMKDAQDVSMLLTRPKWVVYGKEIFPEAEGNTLKGELPSESTARSITATYVYFDELGQFHELGERADFKAWYATSVNVKCRFGWGTIRVGGGQGTLHYKLMEETPESRTFRKWRCHWSEITPYMYNARWRCRSCNPRQEPWDEPLGNPLPPQRGEEDLDGSRRMCNRCGNAQTVRYRDIWSEWFQSQCVEGLLKDKVAIACELQMDWLAAQGDRLFEGFGIEDGVRASTRKSVSDRRGLVVVQGVDPGHSAEFPGAFQAALYDPVDRRFEVFGYWMMSKVYAEFLVPFIRLWTPQRLKGAVIQRGKYSGERFTDVWEYSDDAMRMLDHMAQFAGVPYFGIGGDKYGEHHAMSESPYERLEEYNIFVQSRYQANREIMVRRGVEWAARATIHKEIADLRPMSPLNRPYPTAREIFVTAKPKPSTGQGTHRLDVDKQDPPHVNNGVDAWLYLCRLVDDEVSAGVDPDGGWSVAEEREGAGVVEFGDFSLG